MKLQRRFVFEKQMTCSEILSAYEVAHQTLKLLLKIVFYLIISQIVVR